jgi:hypothetical protein
MSAHLHVSDTLNLEQLPHSCIADCSAPGRNDDAVAFWTRRLGFSVDRERAIKCLLGYGAWELEELTAADPRTLAERILWLACHDFAEWDGTRDSPCGSDIFSLE